MRLRNYRFFDVGRYHDYYDDYQNKTILRRVADRCYLPMNNLLLELFKEYGSAFKVSFSISGAVLDQFRMYAPDVLESFKKLAATNNVEFLAETYSHSLSSLASPEEFQRQVNQHREAIEKLFGQKPVTFRNTEFIYSDHIGEMAAGMGFNTMLTEGAKHILGWKSPNYMYVNAINPKLKLLLRNYQLSDDISFRFSNRGWSEWPVTTDKFVNWLKAVGKEDEVVNLFMDYETFGEHQWAESGIFEFMRALPGKVLSQSKYKFRTPKELAAELQPVSAIRVEHPISWADEERDVTAWLGNHLQDDAFENLYNLEKEVMASGDPEIHKDWHYLQASDHFYYMCTKWFSDGDVHKYFNPYGSPYDAYINYMNVLADFRQRVLSKTGTLPLPLKKAANSEEKPARPVKKVAGSITAAKTKAKSSKKETKGKTATKKK
jgi:alpha-amylase